MIKGSIQEDITIINIYAPNIRALQYVRPLYMLSTRDPHQNKGHIQTESEGLGKDSMQIETKRKQG